MNPTLVLICGGLFALLLVTTGLMLLRQTRQQERFATRVAMLHGQGQKVRPAVEPAALRAAFMRAIGRLGQAILRSGVLSARTRSELEHTLASAGLHGANGLAVFVGAKIMLALGLPLLAWVLLHDQVSGMLGMVMPAVAGILGLLAPDWLIGKKRKKYQQQLERGLPDALDMMVICAQAGLGFGAAVVRVAAELQNAYWEVAQELAQTATDLQMMSDARVALTNLGTRTGVDGYKRLGATLVQTMQYGTPLTDALRTLSVELRQELLMTLEARAARLPILLTVPTLLFILPCVFLIAGGPAIIMVMRAFH